MTQEVFVRVLAAARRSPIENPRAFLHQIARNLVIDHLRKKANESSTFDEQPETRDTLDTSPPVEQQIIDRHEFERFKKVVESLPLKCRQVFILRKIEGLSYDDIAKKLNMSKAAVEKQIVRGLKSCREQLGRHN